MLVKSKQIKIQKHNSLMIIMQRFIIFIFIFSGFLLQAQEKATVKGKISDAKNHPVELVNIAILGMPGGTISDRKGSYEIEVPANTAITLVFSFVGYEKQEFPLNLKSKEVYEINPVLAETTEMLPDIIIQDQRIRNTNLQRIDPKGVSVIPTVTGSVESLIKTMPGVSSRNELSSQYSVRGGNFDENLVYVNDIEIYRPLLVRSGQQEGQSFLNPDLTSAILFSAGGFDAKYGDKMSSVLDIKYKKPTGFAGSLSASLLGVSAHLEGATKNQKFSYLLGVRQKSNQYVLNALETEGSYKPSFFEIQTLLRYDLSEKLEISVLANYANNKYKLIPETRETSFGTIQEAKRLTIYFDGQEVDQYKTAMGAVKLTYKPTNNTRLNFIASAFNSDESETFDIQGQYWIGNLGTDFGSSNFGEVTETQGVGTYLNHARNFLNATVYSLEHKGSSESTKSFLTWGVKFQHEIIDDRLREWEMIDSAGYSLPRPIDQIDAQNPEIYPFALDFAVNSHININSNRYTGYLQNTWNLGDKSRDFAITAGMRANYWDFNDQLLLSPRATISYRPDWKNDLLFRFSSGYYYQPPFYRELRDFYGNINYDIKAQKSIHFVAGSDWNLTIWQRPFKFVTEIYYKYLDDLIPYEVDNVRIRYYSDQRAKGYAAGLDMKINGEFVKGIESWASLSLMKTEEDIYGDYYYNYFNADGEKIGTGQAENPDAAQNVKVEPGFIPRPTDQRFSFSMFFQDYLPMNPSYKMHLAFYYGSSLPFGPPRSERYQQTLRMPSYRRVDIGFSKQLISENSRFSNKNPLNYLKSLWLSLEIFNLLQVNNTISYIWVTDVNSMQYAVPNYLTPRQLNLKLIAQF